MNKTSDSSLSTQQLELASTMGQESLLQQNLSQEVLGQKCTKCGVWKEMDEYCFSGFTNKNGERQRFKACSKCQAIAAAAKRQAFFTKYGVKRSHKQNRVATSPGDIIYKEQIGTPCHCCGVIMTRPHFDHCHETNQYRGWLCSNCNVGIGKLGDNIEGLLRAVDYLKRANQLNEATD